MYGKIKCGNHEITNCKTYKIKDDNCLRHEIIICDECKFCNSKSENCKNCYGKIIASKKENYRKKNDKLTIETNLYRNRFIIENETIIDILEADLFFNSSKTIRNKKTGIYETLRDIIIEYEIIDYDENIGSNHFGLLYGSYPENWKTICQSCKLRHAKENNQTPCQLATEYIYKKLGSISNISSKEILKIDLPYNCICRPKSENEPLQPDKLQKIQYC